MVQFAERTLALERKRPMSTTALWRQHRNTILQATDLEHVIATTTNELTRRCPNPNHNNNETATVDTYQTTEQIQRWYCSECGAGGTAIEWLNYTCDLGTLDAIEHLETLTAKHARSTTTNHPNCIDDYIAQSAELLWTKHGEQGRDWLNEHAILHEPTLRANLIGYDPGPHLQYRSAGLPSNGPAIVFPIVNKPNTPPRYVHIRSIHLEPNHPQWITPARNIADTTTLAFFTPATDNNNRDLLVCNNLTDALTAATLHHPAIAILSGMEMHPNTIDTLQQISTHYPLRVCFPNSPREQQSAATLCSLLADIQPSTLVLPEHARNLNHWHRTKT
jgi:hypothetical protein